MFAIVTSFWKGNWHKPKESILKRGASASAGLNYWKETTVNACEKYLKTTRQLPDVAVYRKFTISPEFWFPISFLKVPYNSVFDSWKQIAKLFKSEPATSQLSIIILHLNKLFSNLYVRISVQKIAWNRNSIYA